MNKRTKLFLLLVSLAVCLVFAKVIVKEFSLQGKIDAWQAGWWEHKSFFSSDGKMIAQADYLKDIPYAHFKIFDPDGRLFSEGHSFSGNTLRQDYFSPDGKRTGIKVIEPNSADMLLLAQAQRLIQQYPVAEDSSQGVVLPKINKTLYLAAAPDLDRAIVEHIIGALQETFAVDVKVLEAPYVVPSNLVARQLNADLILDQAWPIYKGILNKSTTLGLLIIIGQDMRVENMNFIFGTADIARHIGVMSLARFAMDHPPEELLMTRATKQAFSTVGFIVGIGRCATPNCARAYPNSLAEHDRKSATICNVCLTRLARVYHNFANQQLLEVIEK